jgi:hypothetical protein
MLVHVNIHVHASCSVEGIRRACASVLKIVHDGINTLVVSKGGASESKNRKNTRVDAETRQAAHSLHQRATDVKSTLLDCLRLRDATVRGKASVQFT